MRFLAWPRKVAPTSGEKENLLPFLTFASMLPSRCPLLSWWVPLPGFRTCTLPVGLHCTLEGTPKIAHPQQKCTLPSRVERPAGLVPGEQPDASLLSISFPLATPPRKAHRQRCLNSWTLDRRLISHKSVSTKPQPEKEADQLSGDNTKLRILVSCLPASQKTEQDSAAGRSSRFFLPLY